MAQIAKENGIQFVDLFNASLALYTKTVKPLTINGVHLNEHGDHLIAQAIVQSLFQAGPKSDREAAQLEKIRAAVVDKDFYWFNRYRTVDGYNVYGGRSSSSSWMM